MGLARTGWSVSVPLRNYAFLLGRSDSVKVSTGPAQRKKGAQKRPCKQTVLQGQGVFTQS